MTHSAHVDDHGAFAVLVQAVARQGARLGALHLQAEAGARGLHASRRIEAGEELLFMPWAAAITLADARRSEIGQALAAHDAEVGDSGYLAAFLLAARQLASHAPYLDTLPRDFADLPWLHGTDADGAADAHDPVARFSLTGRFAQNNRDRCAAEHAKVAPVLQPRGLGDAEDFQWAYACVSTRTLDAQVDGQRLPSLLPVFDMFNHALQPNAEGANPGDGYRLLAARAIEAGEEVTISYGRKGNELLFSHYGFWLEHNPHDRCCIHAAPDTFLVPAAYADDAVRAMFACLRRAAGAREADASRPLRRDNEIASLATLGQACEAVLMLTSGAEPAPAQSALHRAWKGEQRVLEHYLALAVAGIGLLRDGAHGLDDQALAAIQDPAYLDDLAQAFGVPRIPRSPAAPARHPVADRP